MSEKNDGSDEVVDKVLNLLRIINGKDKMENEGVK